MLCFRIHPKAICFVVIQILFLFLLPPTVNSWFPEFGQNKGGEGKLNHCILPFVGLLRRDVKGEEVFLAQMQFAECVGIVCLVLYVATILILSQFTTSSSVGAGQRKTQQIFIKWFDSALLLPLNALQQRLSNFPAQNPGKSPLNLILNNMLIFSWIQGDLKFVPTKDFITYSLVSAIT